MRSRYVEGKYLLASEATDIELQMLEYFRRSIKNTIGNAFVGDAFKTEFRSPTSVVVKNGEAWYEGFPFIIRSSKDHLVSGNVLSSGILPTAVSIADDTNGEGKLITFNDGGTTPQVDYSVVISAEEQVITSVEDPFLKNANLTESTAQKIRVYYKLNVVPKSSQNNSPIPYTNDTSDRNLVNYVEISPTASGPGDLISTTPLSGSEEVDGRNIEIVLRNDPAMGGRVLPNSSSDQERFQGGKLIDSVGNIYYITEMFNDTTPTNIVLRIDKEVGQLDPTITNGSTYQVWKNDILHANSTTGEPLGKIFVRISDIDWNSTDGILHHSRITDLRETTVSQVDFENHFNQKLQTIATMPGILTWNASTAVQELVWTEDFTLVNPYGNNNIVEANTIVLSDEGAAVYELNSTGGIISKGNETVQVLGVLGSHTTVNTIPAITDLSDFNIGNVVKIEQVRFSNSGLVGFTYTSGTGIIQYSSAVNLSNVQTGDFFRDNSNNYFEIISVDDGLDQIVLDTGLNVDTTVDDANDGSVKRVVVTYITLLDDVNDRITVDAFLPDLSYITIYKDSYWNGYAPFNENSYVLFTRRGAGVWSDYAAALGQIQGLSIDDTLVFDDSTNILNFNADGFPNTMIIQPGAIRVGTELNPPVLTKSASNRLKLQDELELGSTGLVLSSGGSNEFIISGANIKLGSTGPEIYNDSGIINTTANFRINNGPGLQKGTGNALLLPSGVIEFGSSSARLYDSSTNYIKTDNGFIIGSSGIANESDNKWNFVNGIRIQTAARLTSPSTETLEIDGKRVVVGIATINLKVAAGIFQYVSGSTWTGFSFSAGITAGSGDQNSVNLSFSEAFSYSPTVTAILDGSVLFCRVGNLTTTGCTISFSGALANGTKLHVQVIGVR